MRDIKTFIQEDLIAECAITGLEVGDLVSWVNAAGVEWENKVIGFNLTDEYNAKYEKYVHLDTDSFWFPYSHKELTKI